MMKRGDIYLGRSGAEILITPFSRKFSIEDIEISRTERTMSGRMVRDVIETKKTFKMAFELIDGNELQKLINIYNLFAELNLIIVNSNSVIYEGDAAIYEGGDEIIDDGYVEAFEQYTVLMKPISRERVLIRDDGLWGNVNVELNEV